MKNQTTDHEKKNLYHASDMEFNILDVYKELATKKKGNSI